ncbi:MAG: FAD-dependent oxidoreductase [Pseudomonadota bacterium]
MSTKPQFLSCDICVVGAGIGGLNALFAASMHLPAGATAVLIDRQPKLGGMWQTTYEHVRLHQPHQMFTVGDIPWDWDRPPEYLATGHEVLSHLEYSLSLLKDRLSITELYGVEVTASEERVGDTGASTVISAKSVNAKDQHFEIHAKKTVFAVGWGISNIPPMDISSSSVISTSADRLSRVDTDKTAPVFVIGGGKTGTDTAHALLTGTPEREVSLINGSGNVFGNRDYLFPTGLSRYWRGQLVGKISSDIIMRFDGTNFDTVFDYFKNRYGVRVAEPSDGYLFSILSKAEARFLANNLSAIIPDYLEDVVDTPRGPNLLFRSGERRPIKPGSVIVNATGHILRTDVPYTPYASDSGAIATVNPRSAIYFLSTTSTYFLSHLTMMGLLRSLPLNAVDLIDLFKRDRKTFFLVSLTQSYLNMLTVMENVPLQVFGKCGVDMNRWYPSVRRYAAFAELKLNQRRYMDHCEAVLETVRREYGIAVGPLPEPQAP